MKEKKKRFAESMVKLMTTLMLVLLCTGVDGISARAEYGTKPEQITPLNYVSYGFTEDTYKAYVGYYGIRDYEELKGFLKLVADGYTSFNAVLTEDIVANQLERDENGNPIESENLNVWIGIGRKTSPSYGPIVEWESVEWYSDYTYSNSFWNGDCMQWYEGIFDGLGHTICGLYSGNEIWDGSGLFLYNKGTIKNLTLKDSYNIITTGNQKYYGMICNNNEGIIENCHSEGGIVTGDYTGGICGINRGTIRNCTNNGMVIGNKDVGGIAGYQEGSTAAISLSCNNGEILGGADSNAGGICGSISAGTINDCYNTGEVSNSVNCVGGIIGYGKSDAVVTNCYNIGALTCYNGVANSICGNGVGTISNCYYLTDTGVDKTATAKTAKEFASGEVCWLLNGSAGVEEMVWYQKIGRDSLPLWDSASGVVYASYAHNATKANYTNDANLQQHPSADKNGSHDKLLSFVDNGDGTFTKTCSLCGYSMTGLMLNGLQQDTNGNYYYYVYGEVDTDMDGLCQITLDDGSTNWFYFEEGCWVHDKYGFVEYGGGYFLVANGTLANLTGLQQYNGDWYYLSNGQLHIYYTGLALYDGEWFYVENGILDTGYNGIQNYDGSKFLIAAGRLLLSYSGLFENTDGTWYYIASGQVQTNYTGLAQYDGAWFYIQKGVFKTNYTGYVWYNGARFYVYKGTVR